MDLILDRFPHGFDVEDLKVLHDLKGRLIRCLEIKTEEFDYLFKIDTNMIEMLGEHSDIDLDTPDLDDDFNADNDSSDLDD